MPKPDDIQQQLQDLAMRIGELQAENAVLRQDVDAVMFGTGAGGMGEPATVPSYFPSNAGDYLSSFCVAGTSPETESESASVTIHDGYLCYMGRDDVHVAETVVSGIGGTPADPHYIVLRRHKVSGAITLTCVDSRPIADDGTYFSRVLWEVGLNDDGSVQIVADRRQDWFMGSPIGI